AEAGHDPGAFVGALLPAALTNGAPATARIGAGPAFVVEADEYADNFDPYFADLVTLTTVEWDHPDVFADRAEVIAAFAAWIGRVPGSVVVANLEDPGVLELLAELQASGTRTGPVVGISLAGSGGEWSGAEAPPQLWIDHRLTGSIVELTENGTVLDIDGLGGARRRVHLSTVGRHNASNALVALAAAAAIDGAATDEAADRLLWALASFPGIGRRLERKGEARGVVVYDDYGHHPTAIRATLAALRQREPARRVWAVYEPLTFHRTAAMLDDFADVLSSADAVAIADVWAGRDPDTTIASAGDLAAAIQARRPGLPVLAPGSVDATADRLAEEVRSGDVVLVMGGGASYRIGERLLSRLEVTR